MNKKTLLWGILDLIFVIVFNIVFFTLCGNEHPAAVWVAYAFIHLSYILVICTHFLTRKGRDAHLFGTTLAFISSLYFIAVFVVGIVIIAIQPDNAKWTIVVEIIVTGIYLVILLTNILANEHTVDATEIRNIQLQYVRVCSARIKEMALITSNEKLSKKLQKAYDVVSSSQVKSIAAANRYEAEVLSLLEQIEERLKAGDVASADSAIEALIIAANKRNLAIRDDQ